MQGTLNTQILAILMLAASILNSISANPRVVMQTFEASINGEPSKLYASNDMIAVQLADNLDVKVIVQFIDKSSTKIFDYWGGYKWFSSNDLNPEEFGLIGESSTYNMADIDAKRYSSEPDYSIDESGNILSGFKWSISLQIKDIKYYDTGNIKLKYKVDGEANFNQVLVQFRLLVRRAEKGESDVELNWYSDKKASRLPSSSGLVQSKSTIDLTRGESQLICRSITFRGEETAVYITRRPTSSSNTDDVSVTRDFIMNKTRQILGAKKLQIEQTTFSLVNKEFRLPYEYDQSTLTCMAKVQQNGGEPIVVQKFIQLQLKYAPVAVEGQCKRTHYFPVGRRTNYTIICLIKANPSQDMEFKLRPPTSNQKRETNGSKNIRFLGQSQSTPDNKGRTKYVILVNGNMSMDDLNTNVTLTATNTIGDATIVFQIREGTLTTVPTVKYNPSPPPSITPRNVKGTNTNGVATLVRGTPSTLILQLFITAMTLQLLTYRSPSNFESASAINGRL